jgi:hypothetical protein
LRLAALPELGQYTSDIASIGSVFQAQDCQLSKLFSPAFYGDARIADFASSQAILMGRSILCQKRGNISQYLD